MTTDVLMVGAGPAGLALAAALAELNLSVRVVAPHGPKPFPATYGAWWDELPDWVRLCAKQVWTDVRVYTGPMPTPLLRPYALLDNQKLLEALLKRAGTGLIWTRGQVISATTHNKVGDLTQVQGISGETWSARLVIDAAGHGGLLNPTAFLGGPALQTAYGIVAEFKRPPSAVGAVVWMDYRAEFLSKAEVQRLPTFLYAMHLQDNVYFVEETSLIARPAPSKEQLKQRLYARLQANGTPPLKIYETEWVSFPMNAAAPDLLKVGHRQMGHRQTGSILSYGAAAGMVHPISGFQVAAALNNAPHVATAIALALSTSENATENAVAAGWQALWPQSRRAAREIHLLDVESLLNLPSAALPAFFEAFFKLPAEDWQAFLSPTTEAGALAKIMLKVFAGAPNAVRGSLVKTALQSSGASLRALLAAAKAH